VEDILRLGVVGGARILEVEDVARARVM